MNIYFCHEKGESYGLYIIAETLNRAKMLYSAEYGDPYIEIRGHLMRKNVNEKRESTIYNYDDKLLKKYDLEYTEIEDW